MVVMNMASITSQLRYRKIWVRLHLKCDGACAETRFRVSVKRMCPFKSAGASVQSTIGSQGVRISGSNAGYSIRWSPLHFPSCASPCSITFQLDSTTAIHHLLFYGQAWGSWKIKSVGQTVATHISWPLYVSLSLSDDSFIHSFHWHVENVTIPCSSLKLLPFLSVIYPFLLPFSTN
jgi:hypothetical protein